MSATDKKRKTKQKWSLSSCTRRASKAKYILSRTKLKIKRWNRYRDEIFGGLREGSAERWNTSGLENHLKTQLEIIKKGKTL